MSARIEWAGAVAHVVIDRPSVHNAFDDALIATLTTLFAQLATSEARAVVLRSVGPSFSAGADLSWMRRMAGYSEAENLADARALAAMLRALDRLPMPSIARVQGNAFGGGVGLIAACDMAVAAEGALFALSEVRLGIIPSAIGPYVLRAIGAREASRWCVTGERFDCATALRIGLVHQVVPVEDLHEATDRLVGEALKAGPAAARAAKALVRDYSGRPIDDELVEETARRIATLRATPEAKDGLSAFLEKRKPRWMA